MKRAAALGVLCCLAVGACGGPSGDRGRLPANLATPDPPVSPKPTSGPLTEDPAKWGLPPLATVQGNPGGTAEALFQRGQDAGYTAKWALILEKSPGADVGEMIFEHAAGKLHVAMVLGSLDSAVSRLEVLDEGSGSRACVQTGGQPWVCDVKEFGPLLQFLSLQGWNTLTDLLRQVLAIPGVTVQYQKMMGTAAVCFIIPAVPISDQNRGLDLSSGGSFCVSPEGALLSLLTSTFRLEPLSYEAKVDPAKFKMPV